MEVTSEEVHDSKMLKKMVDKASKNNVVKRVLADGTYDSKTNFQYLHDNGIKAAIKVRKNSNSKAMGCYPRKIAVIQQLKDFDKWKDSVSYEYRWVVETVFPSIKRMFGEYVSAKKYPNMAKEFMLKALLYNIFESIKM